MPGCWQWLPIFTTTPSASGPCALISSYQSSLHDLMMSSRSLMPPASSTCSSSPSCSFLYGGTPLKAPSATPTSARWASGSISIAQGLRSPARKLSSTGCTEDPLRPTAPWTLRPNGRSDERTAGLGPDKPAGRPDRQLLHTLEAPFYKPVNSPQRPALAVRLKPKLSDRYSQGSSFHRFRGCRIRQLPALRNAAIRSGCIEPQRITVAPMPPRNILDMETAWGHFAHR
jgi:hypothetical protein